MTHHNKSVTFAGEQSGILVKYAVQVSRPTPQQKPPEQAFGIESSAFQGERQGLLNHLDEFYPRIDLSFLRTNTKNQKISLINHERQRYELVGLSPFAIYSLNNPECEVRFACDTSRHEITINYVRSNTGISKNILAGWMQNLALKRIDGKTTPPYEKEHALENGTYALTTTFDGLIPEHARKEISKAQNIFLPHNVFVIAEAKEWKIKKVHYVNPLPSVRPVVRDPLAIGIHEDKSYLVCAFDTTTLEHYIASEFTDNNLPLPLED